MEGGQTARGTRVFSFGMNRTKIQLGLVLPSGLLPCGKIFCSIYFFYLDYI